jgi:AcrR family transcriptional regulator
LNPAARRSQQERSEATTTALVAAARELFAQDGLAATSVEAVCARAGVTKGALYHHFAGKRELFAAVFSAEQERLAAAIVAAYGAHEDLWGRKGLRELSSGAAGARHLTSGRRPATRSNLDPREPFFMSLSGTR